MTAPLLHPIGLPPGPTPPPPSSSSLLILPIPSPFMMALIYANAVNKRMSQPYKPKKKHSNCPFRDESPVAIREGSRKCSSSREATPQRKASSTSSSIESPVLPTKKEHKHRPVQRSKTSCGDMLNRIDEEGLRKTSSPAMSHSAIGNSLVKSYSKNDIKKALAKKTLIQKYNLEHELGSPILDKDHRRRSISLDAEEWDQQCGQPMRKDSAFQRMKKKLSKWTLG